MYLDNVPECSFAKLIRSRGRTAALRDGDRAVGVIAVSDGSVLPADTLVRFDLVRGEVPGRRLNDALNQSATRALWFYGGDDVARHAAADLQFALEPRGAVFVRRMDSVVKTGVFSLREPGPRDRMTLSEVHAEHAAGFTAPETLFAQIGKDVVGVAMSEALDAEWTEVRVVVYPAYRGRGVGSSIFSALADRLESQGRLVCAALDSPGARGRTALERAGFRIADYYFSARRPAR